MKLYGILYFTIAAVLSVIGTYAEWKNDPLYTNDIYDFFEHDFCLIKTIFIWSIWPITLVMIFCIYVIPNAYVLAVRLLDIIIGGKKK
jgi:hypothetical protein